MCSPGAGARADAGRRQAGPSRETVDCEAATIIFGESAELVPMRRVPPVQSAFPRCKRMTLAPNNVRNSAVGAASTIGWELFSHDADVGVRGFGSTVAEAFEGAALALTALITDAPIAPETRVEVTCDAPDIELLLVEWLNAIIYEMAVRHMILGRFAVRIEATRLRGTLWGAPADAKKPAPACGPKGATYTALRVAQDADGVWSASCVVGVLDRRDQWTQHVSHPSTQRPGASSPAARCARRRSSTQRRTSSAAWMKRFTTRRQTSHRFRASSPRPTSCPMPIGATAFRSAASPPSIPTMAAWFRPAASASTFHAACARCSRGSRRARFGPCNTHSPTRSTARFRPASVAKARLRSTTPISTRC